MEGNKEGKMGRQGNKLFVPPNLTVLKHRNSEGLRGKLINRCLSLLYFKDRGEHEIDRDILLLPEVIIENYDTTPEDVLKPCFDAMWNACGFPRSPNYDDAGKRIESKSN